MASADLSFSSPDDPAVRRRLEAARGYCELHLPDLAWEEIAPLRKPLANAPELMEAELMILMIEKRWIEALALSLRLQRRCPDQPAGWLQASFCLHEMGRTREALERLVSAPKALRKVPLFHYNTGCYLAVLGQLREAMTALRKSFEMDEEFRDCAKSDPDLIAIRDHL